MLEITVGGRAPYQVRHREPLGMEFAHRLVPGTSSPVLVDRADPLIVALILACAPTR